MVLSSVVPTQHLSGSFVSMNLMLSSRLYPMPLLKISAHTFTSASSIFRVLIPVHTHCVTLAQIELTNFQVQPQSTVEWRLGCIITLSGNPHCRSSPFTGIQWDCAEEGARALDRPEAQAYVETKTLPVGCRLSYTDQSPCRPPQESQRNTREKKHRKQLEPILISNEALNKEL